MAFDSLFTGISALNSYQSWIDSISNNIANVDTTGFKGQRMTFADLIYQQLGFASGATQTRGGINPQQLGLGVKVNTVDTVFAQGGLQTTGINTDVALNGDGFFILRNTDGSGIPAYTRDGAFTLNSQGLLIDPATGLSVQGFQANAAGVVTQSGLPGNITIPLGLTEQATGTGFGAKIGPNSNDKVFDMQLGGNLDQTQWSQAFLNSVGASGTAGTPFTVSTTIIDSLGVSHQAKLTYTPDATGAVAATQVTTNAALVTGNLLNGVVLNQGTKFNGTITTTVDNPADGFATVTDGSTTIKNVVPGQQINLDGVQFTVGTFVAADAGKTANIVVTPAQSGLPAQVDDANGVAHAPATRWKVSVSFDDGTTFQNLKTAGTISAANVVTAPTFGSSSSGDLGYAYFDQNGQFINTSSVVTSASANGITANAPGLLHATGQQPGTQAADELDILSWGPGAGNGATAPTGAGAPATGPIGLDFSNNASLASGYTASVINQNGFGAGTLSNITIGQDGTITGAFTNGQDRTLAQLAVATFQNEGGLSRVGGNSFQQTAASGLAQVGVAAQGRFGSIVSGALEQSNVSLSQEFTNLISAQRAFEANTRGIETADQNLQTIIHINATEN